MIHQSTAYMKKVAVPPRWTMFALVVGLFSGKPPLPPTKRLLVAAWTTGSTLPGSGRRTTCSGAARTARAPSSCRWLSTSPSSSSPDDVATPRLFEQDLNIIYDSKCNVCQLEINFLRRRDCKVNPDQPRLKFTDLEGDDDYYNETDPANGGVSYSTGMAAMHAVTSDGRVMQGVPVFRLAYQAVGLGWLFRITTWPGVSWLADRLYNVFAKYRTRLTRGGASVESLVQAYEQKRALQKEQEQTACDIGRCSTNDPS